MHIGTEMGWSSFLFTTPQKQAQILESTLRVWLKNWQNAISSALSGIVLSIVEIFRWVSVEHNPGAKIQR